MNRAFRHRPSPAMLVALLALFISLGGSAYAAFSLPRNSVGTQQLEKGAVTTKKIKNGAVTAAKLKLKGLTVPAASYATNASQAASATIATNADDATNATNAANAGELGGQPPSAYAPSSLFGNPASFTQGSAKPSTYCVIGEVRLYAGIPPAGVMLAAGQVLSISSNPALFTALGATNTYGGNGTTTFALPDLRGAEPKGQGPHGASYYICTQGTYP